MRAVVVTAPGTLELNFTFLPTFIGMNALLTRELEQAVQNKIVGKEWSEETFDFAHDLVLDFLSAKFPELVGLREYLDALKYVAER